MSVLKYCIVTVKELNCKKITIMFNNLNIKAMQEFLLFAKIVGWAVLVGRLVVRVSQLWINFRIWLEESKHPSASSPFRRSRGCFLTGRINR